MTLDTLNSLCIKLGDKALPENERWKSIKYISEEGQMESIDFGYYFKNNLAYFLDGSKTEPGFLILETPYSETDQVTIKNGAREKIVTFIGLRNINGLSFMVNGEDVTVDDIVNS